MTSKVGDRLATLEKASTQLYQAYLIGSSSTQRTVFGINTCEDEDPTLINALIDINTPREVALFFRDGLSIALFKVADNRTRSYPIV